jgi:hypothetical protein
MARIVQCGFEAGAKTWEYTGSNAGTPWNTLPRTGTYSLYLLSGDYGAGWQLPSALTELYLRVAVNLDGGYGTIPQIVTFKNSDVEKMFHLILLNSSFLRVEQWTGGAWAVVATSTTVMPLNIWVCLEMWLKLDNAGDCEVKQDGVKVIDFNGDTLGDQTPASISRVYLGSSAAFEYGATPAYDDFAVNDTTGAVNNSWIGRGGIQAIRPVGPGAHTELAPSSAVANWTTVDEVAPVDSDYVYDAVADQRDTYEMSDLVGTGTIAAVVPYIRASASAASSNSIAPLYYISAADYERTAVPIDVSWTYISQIDEEDPSEIAGTAWTVAKVNSMEVGLQVE